MIDIHDITRSAAEALEAYKEELIERQREAGEIASGRTSASFRVEVLPDGVALVAGGENTAPIGTLEIGSGPHWAPIAPLKEWVKAKGLNISPWAVQRKIAAVGTDRFTSPVQIWSQDVQNVAERITAELVDSFGKYVSAEISTIYIPAR